MANKNLDMLNNFKKYILLLIISILFINSIGEPVYAKKKLLTHEKKTYLTNLSHINITSTSAKDINSLKELINKKNPKAIYIEQWILLEPGNKNLLKKLHKLAQKNKIKLYLVIGKNIWFGKRGIENSLAAFNLYGKHIDGLVLRVEPNRANVWKDDKDIHAQVLNLMLDAYSSISSEAKKRNKIFIAEFPFWLSDFQGPFKSFSQNVCDFTDRVIFLIDDTEKLNKLDLEWNNITCPYNINLTKRATRLSEDSVNEAYYKLKNELELYSNFNGYIIDSDSSLLKG